MGSRQVALAVALSTGLAGCGAGSLSAQQLRVRAAQICSATERRTEAIVTPAVPAQGARYLSLGVDALTPELQALGQLRPAADMAGRYRLALIAGQRELRALRSAVRGLKAGNDPVVEIRTLQQQLAPLEARADGAWASLGTPACESG